MGLKMTVNFRLADGAVIRNFYSWHYHLLAFRMHFMVWFKPSLALSLLLFVLMMT